MACICGYEKEKKEVKVEPEFKTAIVNIETIEKNVFEIGIPISLKDGQLTRGRYRFYFDISKLSPNQVLFLFENFGGYQNKLFNVLGKRIVYLRGYGDEKLNLFITEIEILDNPIPLHLIVGALTILLGGIIAYSLLIRVEKVIEVSKPFALALTLIALIVLINIFR